MQRLHRSFGSHGQQVALLQLRRALAASRQNQQRSAQTFSVRSVAAQVTPILSVMNNKWGSLRSFAYPKVCYRTVCVSSRARDPAAHEHSAALRLPHSMLLSDWQLAPSATKTGSQAPTSALDRRIVLLLGIASACALTAASKPTSAEALGGLKQAADQTQQKYKLKTIGGGTYQVAGGEQLNVSCFNFKIWRATAS